MFRGIVNWISGFDVAGRREGGWWEKAGDGAPTSPPPPESFRLRGICDGGMKPDPTPQDVWSLQSDYLIQVERKKSQITVVRKTPNKRERIERKPPPDK